MKRVSSNRSTMFLSRIMVFRRSTILNSLKRASNDHSTIFLSKVMMFRRLTTFSSRIARLICHRVGKNPKIDEGCFILDSFPFKTSFEWRIYDISIESYSISKTDNSISPSLKRTPLNNLFYELISTGRIRSTSSFSNLFTQNKKIQRNIRRTTS